MTDEERAVRIGRLTLELSECRSAVSLLEAELRGIGVTLEFVAPRLVRISSESDGSVNQLLQRLRQLPSTEKIVETIETLNRERARRNQLRQTLKDCGIE